MGKPRFGNEPNLDIKKGAMENKTSSQMTTIPPGLDGKPTAARTNKRRKGAKAK